MDRRHDMGWKWTRLETDIEPNSAALALERILLVVFGRSGLRLSPIRH